MSIQPTTDPRIVHVASELVVDLRPTQENDGNLQYILDVIDAVDYANEQTGRTYAAGQRDMLAAAVQRVEQSPHSCNCSAPTTTSGEHDGWCLQNFIIAAIKGDSDE